LQDAAKLSEDRRLQLQRLHNEHATLQQKLQAATQQAESQAEEAQAEIAALRAAVKAAQLQCKKVQAEKVCLLACNL
jgi:NADPH-dependent ferric siderophore reductase